MNNHTNPKLSEGFPHQRLVILQPSVIDTCKQLPVVNSLFVTHIGAFPSAPKHSVERSKGCKQSVLIYCMKGVGWLTIGGTTSIVEAGQLLLIPADMPHAYGSNEHQPWSIFWVHFSGAQSLQTLHSVATTKNKHLVSVSDTNSMIQAFEQLYACIDYNYSDAGLFLMSSKLLHLFGLIKLRQTLTSKKSMASEENDTKLCISNMIENSVEYMKQHLHTSISIDELAKDAGVSVPYYCKSFKHGTNQSPIAYFTRLKIRKACDHLYQSTLTVKAIGELLGYSDPYYFSRVFKKSQGCSPEQYRKNLINEGLHHK